MNIRRIIFLAVLFPIILKAQYQTSVDPHTRTLNLQNLVGTTEAKISVNSTFNCSIPIIIPPGTAGMQPELSINYSSNTSNGLLGVGASLGGLSVITRCASDFYHDNGIDGLDFDGNDGFELNGNRLIYNSSWQGIDEKFYRTEFADFSNVKSIGNAGYGPDHFIVVTKDGLTLEFGNTDDSRIEAQGRSEVLLLLFRGY